MIGNLASDDNNREFAGARNPDSILKVTFYVRSLQNNFLTAKEGRPIFQDEKYVQIMIPGRNDLTVDQPVTDEHIQRFPYQWAQFKNQTAEVDQQFGTPVTEWPVLTRSQAEELKGKKFYTVEQIADCSDGQSQALGMNANILRQKARAFLESAKGSAHAQKQAEELAAKQQEIDSLKREMSDLSQTVNAFMAQQKQVADQAAAEAAAKKK